ncbi:MAG: carbohydrate kinase [Oscillospiraceae bacterium]|nr:carbohydrate kinase [Oscillospiraceae bacterium]
MAKLIVIGEALIDFLPCSKGNLAQTNSFKKCPGGAPANVAAAASKFGIESMLVTKLGMDGFGDFLTSKIEKAGINSCAILRTDEANTGLAFVSDSDHSDVEYLFYRAPAADMLLCAEDICEDWFKPGDILHFCSIALVDAPCRGAHDRAIEIARAKGCVISFDVNLRPPLWKDLNGLKEVVLRYIPKADIVKANEEELAFLGDIKAQHLLITLGKEGAQYLGNGLDVRVNGFDVPVVNTTGAGDTFIGTFLAYCAQQGLDFLKSEAQCAQVLRFCNAAAAIVVGRPGALEVMPTQHEVQEFLKIHGASSKTVEI